MPKVRTLTRTFLKGHPRAGQPTHFVEYLYHNLGINISQIFNHYENSQLYKKLLDLNHKNISLGKITEKQIYDFLWSLDGIHKDNIKSKGHTIRNGSHFKPGDYIDIRCWLHQPYYSPQIILHEPLLIHSTTKFTVIHWQDKNNINFHVGNGKYTIPHANIPVIAANDGLDYWDFLHWFKQPMIGQIICWDKTIEY